MTGLACGRCRCLNLEGGPICSACGNPLIKTERHRTANALPPKPAAGGALWLDELEPPRPALQSPARRARIDNALVDLRARKKAARRAHVRRLLRSPAIDTGTSDGSGRQVLVLERHDATRRELRSLLEDFGFSVMSAAGIDEVHEVLVKSTPDFLAVFLGADQEAEFAADGIELCRFFREAGWIQSRDTTAVFLLAAAMRPTDRVRAMLVGCDEVIASPPSRGAVAGALDRRGITLPSDNRRT